MKCPVCGLNKVAPNMFQPSVGPAFDGDTAFAKVCRHARDEVKGQCINSGEREYYAHLDYPEPPRSFHLGADNYAQAEDMDYEQMARELLWELNIKQQREDTE